MMNLGASTARLRCLAAAFAPAPSTHDSPVSVLNMTCTQDAGMLRDVHHKVVLAERNTQNSF